MYTWIVIRVSDVRRVHERMWRPEVHLDSWSLAARWQHDERVRGLRGKLHQGSNDGDDDGDVDVGPFHRETVADEQAHPGVEVAPLPDARRPLSLAGGRVGGVAHRGDGSCIFCRCGP